MSKRVAPPLALAFSLLGSTALAAPPVPAKPAAPTAVKPTVTAAKSAPAPAKRPLPPKPKEPRLVRKYLAEKPVPVKTFKTPAWSADLPLTWTQASTRKLGTDPRFGQWILRSMNRNTTLRVFLQHDDGGPLDRYVAFADKRLAALTKPTKVLLDKKGKEGTRELAVKVFRAELVRARKRHLHTIARVVLRFPENQTIATVTLASTAVRVGEFMERYKLLAKSFALPRPAKASWTPPPLPSNLRVANPVKAAAAAPAPREPFPKAPVQNRATKR